MIKIRRPPAATEIPWAAWANLGFLLLIFSISTTVFGDERGLTLPVASDHPIRNENNRKNWMVLRTDAANQVTMDDETITDLDRLNDRVKERLAGNPELVVSIEPHPRSLYKTMIKLLDEVREAGAARIELETVSETTPRAGSEAGGGRGR